MRRRGGRRLERTLVAATVRSLALRAARVRESSVRAGVIRGVIRGAVALRGAVAVRAGGKHGGGVPYGGAPAGPSPAQVPYGWAPATAVAPLYAGFWRRFWGLCVDSVLVFFLLLPLRIALGLGFMTSFRRGDFDAGDIARWALGFTTYLSIHTVVDWLYFAGMQSSAKQATLGEMMLGVRVTDLAGARIGFWRASGRFVASWLSGLILLVGFIMGAFTARKQTLHDLIAGTLVVRS